MPIFVHLIESPSPADLADGRTEGTALREVFRLGQTPHDYRLAVNRDQFVKALDISDPDAVLSRRLRLGQAPIVHLSMHGDNYGIQLTDGEILGWDDLREILTPLNHYLPDGLLVCFSTCGGAASIRMNMSEDEQHKPFLATVGSFESIAWNDALIAFSTLYHNWIHNDASLEESVHRMRVASNHNGFAVYSGAAQKAEYIQYARNRRLAEAIAAPAPEGL